MLFAQAVPPGAAPAGPAWNAVNPPLATLDAWKERWRTLLGNFGGEGSVSVEGIVTDEKGRPVSDATVGFGPYGLLPFQCNRETDQTGKFRVGLVLPAPADSTDSLVVHADGYAATRLPFAKKPGTYTVSVKLKPGKVYRARVLDQDGHPVRNAFAVIIARLPDRPEWTVQYRTDSDAEGRFAWKGACAEDVAVYIGKPSSVAKIGYHAVAASGRADGKEKVVKLRRFAWEDLKDPPDRIFEFVACFVEPRSAADGRFPLFGFHLLPGNIGGLLGSRYPVQHDYGYFGCWHSLSLSPFHAPFDSPQVPRLLRPRTPDGSDPLDEVRQLGGLPEMRRAPPPFDRLVGSEAHRATAKDTKIKERNKGLQ